MVTKITNCKKNAKAAVGYKAFHSGINVEGLRKPPVRVEGLRAKI
jgi:hypothetical protein